MTDLLLLAGLVLSTSGSFFFSGIETGIYALNRVRLRLRAEDGDPRALRLRELVRRPQLLISTILLGNHLANFVASWCSQGLVRDVLRLPDPELLNTVLLTPLLFVMGEITPKNVFRLKAETLVYSASRTLAAAGVVFRPVALLLRWFGRVTRTLPRTRSGAEGTLARERVETLLREVSEDGVITRDQRRMVANVMRLGSVRVKDAMVAIGRADTIEEGFTRADLLRASRWGRRSRLPVLRASDGVPVGIANVLELAYREDPDPASLVTPAPRVLAGDPLERALLTLRKARQTMAFVTGGGGRVVGIVTVKDLVEEVSGELPVF